MVTTIPITIGPTPFNAELYSPSVPDKKVVVIAYGSDGLVNNDNGKWETMIRGYAEDLSKTGVVVLIPDYLGATGTTPGLASALEARTPARQRIWE